MKVRRPPGLLWPVRSNSVLHGPPCWASPGLPFGSWLRAASWVEATLAGGGDLRKRVQRQKGHTSLSLSLGNIDVLQKMNSKAALFMVSISSQKFEFAEHFDELLFIIHQTLIWLLLSDQWPT